MSEYTPRSDADLEKLAWDITRGQVFHSGYHYKRIVEASLTVPQVFMPLGFMDATAAKWMRHHEIVDCYEYLDEACPGSVNGLPIFMSCKYLNRAEADRLHRRVLDLGALRRDRMRATQTSEEGT